MLLLVNFLLALLASHSAVIAQTLGDPVDPNLTVEESDIIRETAELLEAQSIPVHDVFIFSAGNNNPTTPSDEADVAGDTQHALKFPDEESDIRTLDGNVTVNEKAEGNEIHGDSKTFPFAEPESPSIILNDYIIASQIDYPDYSLVNNLTTQDLETDYDLIDGVSEVVSSSKSSAVPLYEVETSNFVGVSENTVPGEVPELLPQLSIQTLSSDRPLELVANEVPDTEEISEPAAPLLVSDIPRGIFSKLLKNGSPNTVQLIPENIELQTTSVSAPIQILAPAETSLDPLKTEEPVVLKDDSKTNVFQTATSIEPSQVSVESFETATDRATPILPSTADHIRIVSSVPPEGQDVQLPPLTTTKTTVVTLSDGPLSEPNSNSHTDLIPSVITSALNSDDVLNLLYESEMITQQREKNHQPLRIDLLDQLRVYNRTSILNKLRKLRDSRNKSKTQTASETTTTPVYTVTPAVTTVSTLPNFIQITTTCDKTPRTIYKTLVVQNVSIGNFNESHN